MGYTWDEARAIVQIRRSEQSALIRRMVEVRDRYNGEFQLPLPTDELDLDRPIAIPALVNEAVDMPAMHAASTTPAIHCPALDVSKESGKRSVEYAMRRRRLLGATYFHSGWALAQRRFLRHIAGYGWGAAMVVPDDESRMPRVVVRDPLTTYPEPHAPEDVRPPGNIGCVHSMTAQRLVRTYPVASSAWIDDVGGRGIIDTSRSGWEGELWDLLEWVDDENVYIGIIGRHTAEEDQEDIYSSGAGQLLRRWPNRAGMVAAVAPQILTLDKIISRVHHMVGKSDLLGWLLDLDIAATEKAIFPDKWAVAAGNETPQIVTNAGKWSDGRTGDINLLSGVSNIGELRGAPDPNNLARFNQIERNARTDGGIISPFFGETSGALRTGRGIDSLMGAAIDPRIHEMHDIAAAAMTTLNEGIFETFKGYYPSRSYVIFSGWPGDQGHVEFTPTEHIESTENVVEYPIPGADGYQLTVSLAQLVQAGLMSRTSARIKHPHIPDAEAEERRILEEELNDIARMSLQQRAAQGIPPADLAIIIEEFRNKGTINDALIAAQERIQNRQATEAPEPEPGQITAPAAQPGLAAPGEGAEQPLPQGGGGAAPLDPASLLAAVMGGRGGGPTPPGGP